MLEIHRLSYVILLFTALILSGALLSGCSESLRAAKTWENALPNDPNDPTSNRPKEIEITRINPLDNNNMPRQAALPAVKVGILLPLSGQNAALGNSMLQAAQMALFEMGYENFELIPRDTKGNASGASAAAQSAIDNGAQILLGPVFADSVRAAKAAAAPRRINVIAFSTDWTLAGDNAFLMGFMPFAQVERVTAYAVQKGHKNFGLIAPMDKYGDAAAKEFEKNVLGSGNQITRQLRFVSGTNDLSTQIEAFAQNPAPMDAVFIPVGGLTAETIASTLSFHGITPDKAIRIGTGLWEDDRLAREKNLSGAIFAGPSPRMHSEFERRYQNLYNEKPVRLASLAYDATALTAVLAKSGNASFDRAAIMNRNGFIGTDGIFRFKSNGLVDRGLSVMEYKRGAIIEVAPAPTRF
ncbi:MAG: penicillin-binding protein activator [Alphaproteobacteria bacterium]|nr:penicillin-binding protein activator [Alphaproteobacteria bacterium]NCQ89228.1 penicillin-binding protein activator [Alphaproteobacteria bacterium]NCT08096.1 penicillin-binding protein activator [Alphaproteobacteria bacterium]